MKKTGKVQNVTSDPRGFMLNVEPDPPEEPGGIYPYTGISEDQLAVALAAYVKDADLEVLGDPASVSKVTAL